MTLPGKQNDTFHTVLLTIILLVSVINRFYGLDRLSLWGDELWVVMASTKGSLLDMFSFVYYHDNHPPGHYLLMRYWQAIFGNSDFAIRFPFAVSGVFLVYSTYRVAKAHYSVEAGLIAAALVSGISPLIYFSQEARANILIAVTVLWSLHFYCRLTIEQTAMDRKNLVGFWLVSVTGCYLHYAGLVYLACLGVVDGGMALLRWRRADCVRWLTLFVPIPVLYIPWVPGVIHHLTQVPAGAWWSVPEWADLYTSFRDLFGFGIVIYLLYKIAFVALWIMLGILLVRREKINKVLSPVFGVSEVQLVQSIRVSAVILVAVVMPVMVFFIKSRISQPAYDTRHFIYTIPLLSVAAGFVLSLCFSRLRGQAKNRALNLVVMLIIAIQIHFNMTSKLYTGQHLKPEYRESVQTVMRDTNGTISHILVIANSDFFNHYLQRSLNGKSADYLFTDVSQISSLNALIKTEKPSALYFLETPETGGYEMISSLDKALAQFYRPVCRTGFRYAQTIKFSAELAPSPSVDWNQLPVCNKF